jgi:hypothetical protein
VELDGFRGDEERRGHVSVRLALGDEAGDLQFLRRELLLSRGLTTAQRQTRCSELGPRALRPWRGAAALESLERSAEMYARVASLTAAAEPLAEAELVASALEDARLLLEPERFLKRGSRLGVPIDQERATAQARSQAPRDPGRTRLALE